MKGGPKSRGGPMNPNDAMLGKLLTVEILFAFINL